MDKKRCFLSIPIIDGTDFSKILSHLKPQTNIKYSIVKPTTYHFTLHFFGDLDREEIEKIKTFLAEISFEAFMIKLTTLDILPPNPKKGRIFIVKPSLGYRELELLSKRIRKKLLENGYAVDKRKFTPHLTVGRIRSRGNPEDLLRAWLKLQPEEEIIHELSRFVLMESTLTSQGSKYKEIESFPSVDQNQWKG